MEKLVKIWQHGNDTLNAISACENECQNHNKPSCYCKPVVAIRNRLAAYEDTGLTPEEVKLAVMDWGENAGKSLAELALYRSILFAPDGTERVSIDRLREIVEAEVEGRNVTLPCKVGDTVWYAPKYCEEPACGYVEEISTINGYTIIVFYIDPDTHMEAEIKDFGKTVFLTRAEAEAALNATVSKTEIVEAAKEEGAK